MRMNICFSQLLLCKSSKEDKYDINETHQPKLGAYSQYSLCYYSLHHLFSSTFIASSLCPPALRPQTWFRRSDFQIQVFIHANFKITLGQWNPYFRPEEPCYLQEWGERIQQMCSRCVLL